MNQKELKELLQSATDKLELANYSNVPILPRYNVTGLWKCFDLDNHLFFFVGHSKTCAQLVVDALYDEIPFVSIHTDYQNTTAMLEFAVKRIEKDKRTSKAAVILMKFVEKTIPKIQEFLTLPLGGNSLAATNLKAHTILIYQKVEEYVYFIVFNFSKLFK